MNDIDTLTRCEADANAARLQLERDLDVLRSPATVENFKQTIANEAVRVKDSVIESLTDSAKSTVVDLFENVKERATANPSAALAIGAGVALHLMRRPPITTALIGLGLYSLLRTRPATYSGFSQAGENLKKQVSKVASSAQHAAVDIKDAIVEKIQDASEAGLATAASLTADLGERTEVEATKARLSAHDVMDRAAKFTSQVSQSANETLQASATFAQENRDALLLGLAGLAVSTAIGISVQRRLAEI